MSKPKISLLYFFKWLSEQHIQIEKKTLHYPLKLSTYPDSQSHFATKNGRLFTLVAFSGQKNTIENELQVIIDQNLFEYFSPADKKLIFSTYYNTEKFQLTDSYYCHERQMEMLVLTDIETGYQKNIPSHLVVEDDALIEQLNRKDIKKISFIAAMAHFKRIFRNE